MLPLTFLSIVFVCTVYTVYFCWQNDLGLSPFTSVSIASPQHFASAMAHAGVLDWATTICTALFLMANADKVMFAMLSAFVVNNQVRPAARKRLNAYLRVEERNHTQHELPIVAIQVPLFNEAEVARRVIQHVCAMSWPKHKLLIQILDDSTKDECRQHVDEEVQIHRAAGINIVVLRREDRRGFKAGALNDGVLQLPAGVKYAAIFDADFMPTSTFLQDTVPFLESDDMLAFVQTKWTYVNGKDSLLSMVQLVNLNFHHYIEQTVRSYFGWFANFCGTWRLLCLQVDRDTAGANGFALLR